jgi:isopenicillin N synthase-like dioxygenase
MSFQTLAANILALLADPLRKYPGFFSRWLDDSLSALRLVHHSPVAQPVNQESAQEAHAKATHTQ